MHESGSEFCEVWDLGDRWHQHTGLPFVFAAWVAVASLPCDVLELATVFEEVRDHGFANARSIASSEATQLGIDPQFAYDYLTKKLHFRMGPSEQRGMQEFAKRCSSMGLLQPTIPAQRFNFTTPLNNCSA